MDSLAGKLVQMSVSEKTGRAYPEVGRRQTVSLQQDSDTVLSAGVHWYGVGQACPTRLTNSLLTSSVVWDW